MCAVCLGKPALRFSLTRAAKKPDGSKTSRGCGMIRLCQPCWQKLRARSVQRRVRA